MFLNYLSLLMVLCSITAIFYLFIYIHELPYESAKHRNHPHKDAIYVACWLSLFTLHALWPLVFIWALSHKEFEESDREVLGEVATRIAGLEDRLGRLEANRGGAK